MNILLTGAAGFTGVPFTEQARAAGHQVIALGCDLNDKSALRREVLAANPDHVVHLAAISFVGAADEQAFYAVNVVGAMNLLDAVAELPLAPRRVLLASSANVYGNCAASPIVETEAAAPMNHYAMSKLAMEHMAHTYAERLSLIVTRPFNYTGVGQPVQFLVPKLVSHFARRAPLIELGNLDVEREFNDVEMVCASYLRLLEHGEAGETYNICTGTAYSLQHLIDTLSRLSGHEIEVRVNPQFVRRGEVHRLCGSPVKLQALLNSSGGPLVNPGLEATLGRMLAAATASGMS